MNLNPQNCLHTEHGKFCNISIKSDLREFVEGNILSEYFTKPSRRIRLQRFNLHTPIFFTNDIFILSFSYGLLKKCILIFVLSTYHVLHLC